MSRKAKKTRKNELVFQYDRSKVDPTGHVNIDLDDMDYVQLATMHEKLTTYINTRFSVRRG